MLKRNLLPVFTILFTSICFSQDLKLNSLTNASDSITIKKYLNYAKSLNGRNNKEARELYEIIIGRSKLIHYKYGAGDACLNMALLDMWNGDYADGIKEARTALIYFKDINDRSKIGYCFFIIGKSHFYLDHKDSAMNYLFEGLRQVGNVQCKELALLNNFIGKIIFVSADDVSKALPYHITGYDISKRFRDTSELIYGGTCLADDYIELNKLEEAYKYTLEIIRLSHATNNYHDLGVSHNFACFMFYKLNKTDSAVWAGKHAIQYGLLSGDINIFLKATINLARAYNSINNQKLRLTVLKEGLDTVRKLKDKSIETDIFCLGLADACYKSGRYKEAYEYYKQYTNSRDEEEVIKTNFRISELELKYQTAQKGKVVTEQRLQIAKKDLLLQRNRNYVYLSLSMLVLVLLFAALVYIRHLNNKKDHIRQLIAIKQEKEIHLLEALMEGEEKERSRIAKELHDGIAGMLVAVKLHMNGLTEQKAEINKEKDFVHVINLLDETYNEVRKTSHNLMPEVLLKHGLDEAIRRYCNNIGTSNKLVIQYDSWGKFGRYKSSFELSVYRIVQELIGNIIKHSKANIALLQMNIQGSLLSIDIEDNGIGLPEKEEYEGMGLHNIRSKVKAMDGKIELVSVKSRGVCAYLEFDISQVINPINE